MAPSGIPPLVASAQHPYQVGIVVPDLEAAMRAYGPPRGAGDVWRLWTYGERLLSERRFRGSPGTFEMLIALGGSDPQLELIQPLEGPSIYHEHLAAGGSGLHHLAFRTTDLATTTDEMERAGFGVLQSGVGFGADGSGGFAYYDTMATLGYIAEAVEAPRVRREPERTC